MKTTLTFEGEREIEKYLEKELSTGYFKNFSVESKKTDEIGHSHGPGVQKEVAKLLSKFFSITFVTDNKGKKKKRALADCLIDSFICSIKFGVCSIGQPNLGSMKRIMTEVLDKDNDVIYVAWVNFDIETNKVKVWFINILNFSDCLTWNAGTGQVMIDKSKLSTVYTDYLIKGEKNNSLKELKSKIVRLYKVGMDKHIELREKQKDQTLKKYEKHML